MSARADSAPSVCRGAVASGRFHGIVAVRRLIVAALACALLAVALVTVVFGAFAARLELKTRYDQLLPDSQPSVIELHRVEARTASAQTATATRGDLRSRTGWKRSRYSWAIDAPDELMKSANA